MKRLRLRTMDGIHVTFAHQTKNIDINISIDVALEYDFLPINGNFVQHKFDLFKSVSV